MVRLAPKEEFIKAFAKRQRQTHRVWLYEFWGNHAFLTKLLNPNNKSEGTVSETESELEEDEEDSIRNNKLVHPEHQLAKKTFMATNDREKELVATVKEINYNS